METVITSMYCDWHVVIHCLHANSGSYRSVAFVRDPGSGGSDDRNGDIDTATVLQTARQCYPSALLSNAAALASARRFIEAAGGQLHLQ